jgi:adenylate cyclase
LGARLEDFRQSVWTKIAGILGGIVLVAGLGLVLLETGLGDALVSKSYDLPFAFRPDIKPQEAVLVYLDDTSYEHLHQKYTQAWDRAYFTRLLTRLKADGAAAVVFDIVFSDALDPKTDQEFADAMADFGKVILASDFVIQYYSGSKQSGKVFTPPLQLFNEHALDVGCSTLFPVEGEYIRKYEPTIANNKGANTNSEALAAALVIKPDLSQSNLLKTQSFWMNYYAPDLEMPSVSFYKAIADNDPDAPPGYFTNKVVFVGAKLLTHLAAERKDEFSTPFSYLPQNQFMAGVCIHATAFLNIIRGDYLRMLPYWANRGLIVAIGVIFGGGLVLCRPVLAVVLGLLCAWPIYRADFYAFTHWYYWFPWLIVVAVQIPAAIVWAVTYNSIRLHVERKLFEQSLALYLTPKLVKKFADNPALRRPGAKKQMLTILFTDIESFTTLSEGMDPDDLARLMNAYFQGAVKNCIFSTEGTVVKYIGDAIFAFWNAPDAQLDHAYRGCEAALRFCALPPQRTASGAPLVTRLGLHTGEANVGNFGSDQRFDYTALGENINLASRMEGLNKYLGTRVLITGDTEKEAGSRVVTRYVGVFRLKGFEKAVQVYELLGFPSEEAASRPLRERFATALGKFVKKDFSGAEAAFREVQQIVPKDGPSEFYLEHIEEMRAAELPPSWKGEMKLKDK